MASPPPSPFANILKLVERHRRIPHHDTTSYLIYLTLFIQRQHLSPRKRSKTTFLRTRLLGRHLMKAAPSSGRPKWLWWILVRSQGESSTTTINSWDFSEKSGFSLTGLGSCFNMHIRNQTSLWKQCANTSRTGRRSLDATRLRSIFRSTAHPNSISRSFFHESSGQNSRECKCNRWQMFECRHTNKCGRLKTFPIFDTTAIQFRVRNLCTLILPELSYILNDNKYEYSD